MLEFKKFPSIKRLSREIIVTEKIDGTNAQIYIELRANCLEEELNKVPYVAVARDGMEFIILAGSRSRWLGKGKEDNFGLREWVDKNAEELILLGPGRHFGEWWGKGIQRGYGLAIKKFSLFNVSRWFDFETHKKVCPSCCDVVPLMYRGAMSEQEINRLLLSLEEMGSSAAPGFMNPEGIVIYHTAANVLFKKTIKNDEGKEEHNGQNITIN